MKNGIWTKNGLWMKEYIKTAIPKQKKFEGKRLKKTKDEMPPKVRQKTFWGHYVQTITYLRNGMSLMN